MEQESFKSSGKTLYQRNNVGISRSESLVADRSDVIHVDGGSVEFEAGVAAKVDEGVTFSDAVENAEGLQHFLCARSTFTFPDHTTYRYLSPVLF